MKQQAWFIAFAAAIAALPATATTSAAAEAAAVAKTVKVFILAGQSNMVGHCSIDGIKPPLDKPQPAVRIYWHNLYQPAGQPWQELKPGFGAGMGPEVSFGYAMSQAMPGQKMALIKVAAGASSLADQWSAGEEGKAPGLFYNKFLDSVKAALKSIDPKDKPELAGMLWMQGESDAMGKASAQAYEKRLARFITKVREDLKAPKMPLVIGLISEAKPWTFAQVLREGQRQVAKTVLNVGIVETKDLSLNKGDVHYDTAGQIALGERFAKAILATHEAAKNSVPR